LRLKILILSDLHLEFHRDCGKSFAKSLDKSIDAVILAGDICTIESISAYDYLCEHFYPKPIVAVLGNHEFYKSSFDEVVSSFSSITKKHSNFNLLNNSHVTIDEQRFIGSTMWFPQTPQTILLKNNLNDFNLIKDFGKWVYQENAKSVRFLKENLTAKDIVISHHAPSTMSIAERYKNTPLNDFFYCNMEDLILNSSPKMWIHGHMHNTSNYTIGETNVICNPFGYIGRELNGSFKENLVINVGE